MRRRLNNKRGVSPVIGYILLVSLVIIISLVVYQWVKTYIPREALECPDGVSLFVKEKGYTCDPPGNTLTLTLKNNGRFNISGYFIRSSGNPDLLATDDLSRYANSGAGFGRVSFSTAGSQENTLAPGKEQAFTFDSISSDFTPTMSFIEIIPVRYEEIDNRLRLSSCSDARIQEVICENICSPTILCDGTCKIILDNGCGEQTICDGTCPNPSDTCTAGVCSDCGDGILNGAEECDYNGGLFCNDDTQPSPCTCQTGYIPGGGINCVAAPDLTLTITGVSQPTSKSITINFDIENIGTADAGGFDFESTSPTATDSPQTQRILGLGFTPPTNSVPSSTTFNYQNPTDIDTITLTVDSQVPDEITEVDETNNQIVTNIDCSSGPCTWT